MYVCVVISGKKMKPQLLAPENLKSCRPAHVGWGGGASHPQCRGWFESAMASILEPVLPDFQQSQRATLSKRSRRQKCWFLFLAHNRCLSIAEPTEGLKLFDTSTSASSPDLSSARTTRYELSSFLTSVRNADELIFSRTPPQRPACVCLTVSRGGGSSCSRSRKIILENMTPHPTPLEHVGWRRCPLPHEG